MAIFITPGDIARMSRSLKCPSSPVSCCSDREAAGPEYSDTRSREAVGSIGDQYLGVGGEGWCQPYSLPLPAAQLPRQLAANPSSAAPPWPAVRPLRRGALPAPQPTMYLDRLGQGGGNRHAGVDNAPAEFLETIGSWTLARICRRAGSRIDRRLSPWEINIALFYRGKADQGPGERRLTAPTFAHDADHLLAAASWNDRPRTTEATSGLRKPCPRNSTAKSSALKSTFGAGPGDPSPCSLRPSDLARAQLVLSGRSLGSGRWRAAFWYGSFYVHFPF